MRPLLKLKQYFTIEEVAEHLSSLCDSPFSSKDVYQLVYDGHLPIACRFTRHDAVEVSPETLFSGLDPDDPSCRPKFLRDNDAVAGGLSEAKQKPATDFSLRHVKVECERQANEIRVLDGVYKLWLDGPHYLNYVKWLANGNDPHEFDWISLLGVCVYSADGTLLQPVTRAEGTANVWRVSTHTPEPCDFLILAADLLTLESLASVQPVGTTENETPLHGKERTHYLKVIAGLLSKSKIGKKETATHVLTLLEAEGQQSIDRATLSKTLTGANNLRK